MRDAAHGPKVSSNKLWETPINNFEGERSTVKLIPLAWMMSDVTHSYSVRVAAMVNAAFVSDSFFGSSRSLLLGGSGDLLSSYFIEL